jgi:hypothetical protein
MHEALPTPHPLKPIAFFAFEPTLGMWGIALALLIVLAVLLLLLLKPKRGGSLHARNALASTCAELERLAVQEGDLKDVLAKGSELTKRYLATSCLVELRELDSRQIAQFAATQAPPYARQLLEAIATLDERRFQKSLPANETRALFANLPEMIRRFSHSRDDAIRAEDKNRREKKR